MRCLCHHRRQQITSKQRVASSSASSYLHETPELTTDHRSMAAMGDFDPALYMACPGPIVGGVPIEQCSNVIPKDVVCTGPNRGKRYRRVSLEVFYVYQEMT